MSKIQVGQDAPHFALESVSGQPFSLAQALGRGPVVAAFFKVNCPTCQFTFPFLERLSKVYGGEQVSVVGISQDDAAATQEFCEEYGVTFPALLDTDNYSVSNDYGLINVPTYYLISRGGRVQVSSVGFTKKALETISDGLAKFLGHSPVPVFLPEEIVPESKPG